MVIDQVHYPMDVIEIDDTMINTDQDPPEFPEVRINQEIMLIVFVVLLSDSLSL